MAAAADYCLPLSPGKKEPTSCSTLLILPVSILDLDSFKDRKTAKITSPATSPGTCSFDNLAAVVASGPLARATEPFSPPLKTRLAPLDEFYATAVESLDELVAQVGKCGIYL